MPNEAPPEPGARIAIFPRPRLGDGLVTMVLADNLLRAGFRPTVFHDALHSLATLFPAHDLCPATGAKGLASFELAYVHSPEMAERASGAKRIVIGRELVSMGRKIARPHLYRDLARELCDVTNADDANGAQRPAGIEREAKLIAIHPESLDPRCIWPQHRFIELAERIRDRGFDSIFIVAPSESERWRAVISADRLFVDADLNSVVRRLAAARMVIGNDSGIGHLASCVGTPTLTLFSRPALVRRWRPHWAPSAVVLPVFSPPGAALQLATWRQLTSVARVEREFVAFLLHTD
ncbi:MAG: hypothetical protein ACI841_000616 [Planctomycetota bacterium]